MSLYPIDGGIPADAPVHERLRGFVVALLKRMTDRGRLGLFHRLRMLEMANPTGLIDRVRWQAIQPMRDYIRGLLQELVGPGATEQQLDYCEFNLVGPCLMVQLTCHTPAPGRGPVPVNDVDAFADHCTEFLLAGIKAMRAGHTDSDGKP